MEIPWPSQVKDNSIDQGGPFPFWKKKGSSRSLLIRRGIKVQQVFIRTDPPLLSRTVITEDVAAVRMEARTALVQLIIIRTSIAPTLFHGKEGTSQHQGWFP